MVTAGYAWRRSPGFRDDGRDKILSGVTTVPEVLRVTLEDCGRVVASHSGGSGLPAATAAP
jgi:hypothetical protein